MLLAFEEWILNCWRGQILESLSLYRLFSSSKDTRHQRLKIESDVLWRLIAGSPSVISRSFGTTKGNSTEALSRFGLSRNMATAPSWRTGL